MGLACDPLDRKARHEGWGPSGGISPTLGAKCPARGCSCRLLRLLAVPVRVDCAALSDHFSLCELFFSFRGLGESIASVVEIKNTALKIRRAGRLQVRSGVTEIGLCFTAKLNTPISTPEL